MKNIPLPKPKATKIHKTVQIDASLLELLARHRPKGVTFRQVVEYGIKLYLEEVMKK